MIVSMILIRLFAHSINTYRYIALIFLGSTFYATMNTQMQQLQQVYCFHQLTISAQGIKKRGFQRHKRNRAGTQNAEHRRIHARQAYDAKMV